MVERLTTFVEGFRNDDYFEGAEVGQVGEAAGFQAGVLARFPEVTDPDVADDQEYLLFGNGDFSGAAPEGWSITALQEDDLSWTLRFSIAFDSGLVEFAEWNVDNAELPVTQRSVFVHAFWDPTVPGDDPTLGFWVNGTPTATLTKIATPVPSTLRPRIGGGPLPAPLTQPIVEPRISIAGACYRTGDDTYLGNYGQSVFERVQEVDDITQLPDGSFLWDNIWSARRRLPNINRADQAWNDLTDEVAFVRTGGGNTLQVNAAKAHWWNQ